MRVRAGDELDRVAGESREQGVGVAGEPGGAAAGRERGRQRRLRRPGVDQLDVGRIGRPLPRELRGPVDRLAEPAGGIQLRGGDGRRAPRAGPDSTAQRERSAGVRRRSKFRRQRSPTVVGESQ